MLHILWFLFKLTIVSILFYVIMDEFGFIRNIKNIIQSAGSVIKQKSLSVYSRLKQAYKTYKRKKYFTQQPEKYYAMKRIFEQEIERINEYFISVIAVPEKRVDELSAEEIEEMRKKYVDIVLYTIKGSHFMQTFVEMEFKDIENFMLRLIQEFDKNLLPSIIESYAAYTTNAIKAMIKKK